MESVQTQQERDRQTRLERRRQQERERRARETPEERDRRRSLRNQRDRERRRARCAARCASALAQLERVCTCIIIRIRIYIRELAHARPPMSSISLVLCWVESISSSLEVKKSITTTIIDASKNGLVSLFGVSVPLHSHANSLYHPQNCSSLLTSSPCLVQLSVSETTTLTSASSLANRSTDSTHCEHEGGSGRVKTFQTFHTTCIHAGYGFQRSSCLKPHPVLGLECGNKSRAQCSLTTVHQHTRNRHLIYCTHVRNNSACALDSER